MISDETSVLILGDSMLRGMEKVCHASIVVRPGSTAARLERFILSSDCPHLAQFSTIVIAIGTNDIGKPAHVVKGDFIKLFDAIHSRTQRATVAFCTILPRPRDHRVTRAPVKALNDWLGPAVKRNGFVILNPQKLFRSRDGTPHFDLFRDGLHLNEDGIRKFRDFLRTKITELTRM